MSEKRKAWVRAAAAWMFGTAAMRTTYGNYIFSETDLKFDFGVGAEDVDYLIDELYRIGDGYLLQVDYYYSEDDEDNVYDLTVSDYYTVGEDE